MISRITYSLLVFFLVCFASPAFAQLDSLYTQQWNRDPILNLNATSSAQRQIITAEQIRVSGYLQLSEVFQLIDGWTIAFQEGYPPQLQSNGTGSYNQQTWILMLNGQRIEMDRDPGMDVNQLGIPIYDIERIEVVNTNGMYLGEFTQNGLINIITKKSTVNGINASAYVGVGSGNQPFNYSNYYGDYYETDNITATLGFTQNKFHLNTSFTSIQEPYKSDQNRTLSRLEIQYTGDKISHQIQTKSLYGAIDGYAPYSFITYLGQWNINQQNQIRLSSSIFNDYYSGLITNNLQHRYLKRLKKGNFIWQNGIAYDYIGLLSTFSNKEDFYAHIIKPYTSLNIPITRKANLFSDVQVAFANTKIAPKVSLGIYKRVSLISNYSFVVGYTETLLEESFLTSVNQDIIDMGTTANYQNSKLATADIYYNINIGNAFKFSFNSGLKKSFDLPDYEYVVQVPTGPFITRLITEQQVQPSSYQFNWINRLNIRYDIIKNVAFDLNYMHTGIVNSWNETLRPIPKHKFTLIVQYELPKRFTLWSRNYIQSKTEWYASDGYYLNGEYTLFHTDPPFYTWDIGVSKKLFKEYLKLNFTLRSSFFHYKNSSGENVYKYETPLSLSILFNVAKREVKQ